MPGHVGGVRVYWGAGRDSVFRDQKGYRGHQGHWGLLGV